MENGLPEKTETQESVEAESILNPENGELPFAYFNPETEGKLVWLCNHDPEGNVTSVFTFNGPIQEDRRCQYLKSVEEAKEIRDELVKCGWKKLKPPKVTFTYPGQKEGTSLSRKQRRYLQKQIRKLDKKNPYKNQEKS